jgi:hypothetical protein
MRDRGMKVVAALACVAVAMCAVASAATPKKGKWEGAQGPLATNFTVKKKGESLLIQQFKLTGFTITCSQGSTVPPIGASANGAAKIKHGRFEFNGAVNGHNSGQTMHATGHFKTVAKAGGTAKINIRGDGVRCTSGRFHWQAERG